MAAGVFLKLIGEVNSPGIANHTTTHKRMDALGWGVLLAVMTTYHDAKLRVIKWLPLLFFVGAIILAADIVLSVYWKNYYFEKILFSSVVPLCFFLMILGLYYHDFSKWKPLRFVAYYSYNWYLWHPLFVLLVSKYFGVNALAMAIYIIVSFLVAMLFTILVEERFLGIREAVLNKIFKKTIRAAS